MAGVVAAEPDLPSYPPSASPCTSGHRGRLTSSQETHESTRVSNGPRSSIPAVPYLVRDRIPSEPSRLAAPRDYGREPRARSARGRIKDMAAAWISWGKEHYL